MGEDVNLGELAKLTEGMEGAQIAFICRNATMNAITELIQEPRRPSMKLRIFARHLKDAIQTAQKKEGFSAC